MAEITLDHVGKAFSGTTAVDDVSLEIADGEFLVLVGPSGCGKSTLLRLMDEPRSNLDAKLRVGMRASLAQLHRRLGTTTVYVTHDQVEAMTLGQRVAVMRDGRIVQADEPQRLYQEPNDLFVAAFIGSPAMNLVDARVEGGAVAFGQFSAPLGSPPPHERVVLGLRPESFEAAAFAAPGLPSIEVEVGAGEEPAPAPTWFSRATARRSRPTGPGPATPGLSPPTRPSAPPGPTG